MATQLLANDRFVPVDVLTVTTENSVWLLGADWYERRPRFDEVPRPPLESIKGRLDDEKRHGARGFWWIELVPYQPRVRILPTVGPEDGYGVVTGVIVSVEGKWMTPSTD